MNANTRPRLVGGPANQPALDRYTSAHMGVGIAAARYGLPLWALLTTAIGWELVENQLKDRMPHLFPYSSHDSMANSIADTVAAILGYVTARAALEDPNLDPRWKAAIHSASGAAVGGIIGAATFGFVGRLAAGETQHKGQATNRAGSVGYIAGAAAGAGLSLPGGSETQTAVASASGAVAGPVGALFGGYAAQRVT